MQGWATVCLEKDVREFDSCLRKSGQGKLFIVNFMFGATSVFGSTVAGQ